MTRVTRMLRTALSRFRRSALDKETRDYLPAMQEMQNDPVIEEKVRELADGRISVSEFRTWLTEYEARRTGDYDYVYSAPWWSLPHSSIGSIACRLSFSGSRRRSG